MNVNKVELRSQLEIKEEAALKCMEFATQYMLKKAEYRLLNPLHYEGAKQGQIQEQSQLMAELNSYCFAQPKSLSGSIKKNKIQIVTSQNKQDNTIKHLNLTKEIKWSQNKKQLDFSSDQEEAKSSASSKKSRNKFEKVVGVPKKQNPKNDIFSGKEFDFKKKDFIPLMGVQRQSIDESPVIKAVESQVESSDSFDNFPLGQKKIETHFQEDKQVVVDFQDLDSYHSSILSQPKNLQIDIVSEHLSEQEVSQISNPRKPQLVRVQSSAIHSNLQSHLQQQLARNTQNQVNQADMQNHMDQKQQIEQELSPEEINKQLTRLELFQVQQEILMKKLSKVWTREFNCLRKVKSVQWEDLKLPKPTFRIQTHQYAQVIE